MTQANKRMDLRVVVLICFGGLLVFFALVSGGALLTFRDFYKRPSELIVPKEIYRQAQRGAYVSLSGPSADNQLKESRRQEEIQLKTYGWIDRSQGIIHIPIDRAMDMIIEHDEPSGDRQVKE